MTSLPMRASKLLDAHGNRMQFPIKPNPHRLSDMPRTGIDAAADSRHTDKHFTDATGQPLSNVLAQDLDTVRKRLRYEVPNNGDATGMVDTLATAIVGIGPSLQVYTGNSDLDAAVEDEFSAYADDCDFVEPNQSLAELLAQGIRDDCLAGEDFLSPTTDPDFTGAVKLRLQGIAPELVSTPWSRINDSRVRNGIEFDERGKKIRYWVAGAHPRDSQAKFADISAWRAVDVRDMIHSFIRLEAGQHRGYPWFAPALPEMAATRRWVLAVLSAAETAADVSFVLQTTLATLDEPVKIDEMDVIHWARNAGLTLPAGWEAHQFKAEQPQATHKDFIRERLRSMGRPLGMPYNVAAADSTGLNFASGRLDQQLFYVAILVKRSWLARRKLKPIFRRWLGEASLAIPALRPLAGLNLDRIARTAEWYWRSPQIHGDPLKESKAITEQLHNGSKTFIDVCSEAGLDWQVQLQKKHKVDIYKLTLAAELKAATAESGLTPDEAAAALASDPADLSNLPPDEMGASDNATNAA